MAGQQQTLEILNELIGDKYEIIRWIGGGGMAEVYLARHRITGGYFAVKVLADHLAGDDRIVARFIQESRTAATLSGHPNIVSIFDIGEGNGLHYLIMQYIAGEDLSRFLKREGRLPASAAANIVAQIAEALCWSSSKGVVHRDLKPSNLHLDRNGRVIVLDFGIAKAADIPSGLTAVGERLGTPYYMCPEQIRGQECDVRSDLYSLGVIFYELLTGQKPFDGESYRAIEMAHITTVPVDLHSIDPSLNPGYKRIVDKLLHKEPGDRYQSAPELVSDLQELGATPAPSALRPSLDRDVEAELARHATPTGRSIALDRTTPIDRSTPARKAGMRDPAPAASIPTPQLPVIAPAVSTPHTSPSNMPVLLGIAFLVAVILLAGGYLFLKRSKTPQTDDRTSKPALAPSLTDEKTGITMMLVAAGEFVFGSNADPGSPNAREIKNLPAYYIDQTEVSNAQYKMYCDETGAKPPDSQTFSTHPDFPVANVSLEDAEKFASWAGKRIPTEEEWEKAARGKSGATYPWGNDPWARGAGGPPSEVQPVNSFPDRKSPYGAYNMAGNVAEWTEGHFPAGPTEWSDLEHFLGNAAFSHFWFAIKGGYFGSNPQGDAAFKTYMRRGWPKDLGSSRIGFRCVRSAG